MIQARAEPHGHAPPSSGSADFKPTQNAYIESFNGRFRDECLNEHWFTSLAHARVVIEAWWREYNEERPKQGLGGLTPAAYGRQLVKETVQSPFRFGGPQMQFPECRPFCRTTLADGYRGDPICLGPQRNSSGANPYKLRRHVCHSCAVPGDS